jgi:iron complex outermembrane recepter protein
MVMSQVWAIGQWALALSLLSSVINAGIPARAQERGGVDEWMSGRVDETEQPTHPSTPLPIHPSTPHLSNFDQPATTVEEWIAQIEASLVQITNVRVETTETGLQVILETAEGFLEVPETRSIGNALIADISNAAIAEEFSQAEPIEGIALVSVTELPDNRVRVAITGTDTPPTAEITTEDQGLVLAVALGDADAVAEEDAIQVVVTGEQDEGYNPSSASTATRIDTPLRDIPQSIQVVPREVIEDRNVRTVTEAVETVSGVLSGGTTFGSSGGSRIIRGFSQEGNLRNGFRDADSNVVTPVGTIEQIEVLKGPASVLFGALEPGGVINVITRQPLSEPYYNVAFELGNYGFYQPSIDLSGPLTEDDTLLYRFIVNYQNAGSIVDFVNSEQVTIAPSITLNLGDRTALNLFYEFVSFYSNAYPLDSPLLSDDSLLPRDFYAAYPFATFDFTGHRFGYTFSHEFSDSLGLRNGVSVLQSRTLRLDNFPAGGLENDRLLAGFEAYDTASDIDNYSAQLELLARFNTGSIAHQLLAGVDFNRFVLDYEGFNNTTDLPPLDISDPDYDVEVPEVVPFLSFYQPIQSHGVYLQDQIDLLDNLKLLIGGRYDWISSEFETFGDGRNSPFQNDVAFSPRIGLVYQPSDTVSLYTSYSRSFRQSAGFNPDGEAFEPTRGTQYEVGVKADFLDGGLTATLAAYRLTRANVTTPDPNNPLFSVQTGEQRSQGIELDVTGEILPGWNVIVSYAYTDARVTEDNTTPEGNRLPNVPENQASLWTTYEIQDGVLQGLGFGLGLFYVGERQVDLANSATLSDYLRVDAGLYYRRGRFRSAINVRNLLDEDYASFAFNSRNFVQRGEPFTITGSVSWEF